MENSMEENYQWLKLNMVLLWVFYIPYRRTKNTVKSDQFFNGDQYFSSASNFTWLNITPTESVYQLFYLLNKNQIMGTLSGYRIYYNIIWLSGVTRQLIIKNSSFALIVVVKKKKTSTLTLILMNLLTRQLVNFLFLKYNFKGTNKAFWLTCVV